MVCLYCQSETQVVNSRHQKRQNQVWRRRKCLGCEAVFSTIESIDTTQALHVRKSDHLEPFKREQLLISIYESLKHREHPIEDATALANTVWSQLLSMVESATILREHIIEVTATTLEHFDTAAATHYRAFNK